MATLSAVVPRPTDNSAVPVKVDLLLSFSMPLHRRLNPLYEVTIPAVPAQQASPVYPKSGIFFLRIEEICLLSDVPSAVIASSTEGESAGSVIVGSKIRAVKRVLFINFII